jgi:type VI secretion system protein ImpG
MFNRYFKEELSNLKDLGGAFSEAHPAIAPLLRETSADPDVERLLEGVAFLTAMLRQKLDDEFPEIVHELMGLIWPHYLRPLPAATIVAFAPKPTIKQSMTIPAGIQLASVPVEGTSCLFRTCFPIEVHPLKILGCAYQEPSGQARLIRITLELTGLKLSDWQPQSLRFFLRGEYTAAADLYRILRQHLQQIVLQGVGSGRACSLPPEHLKPAGFEPEDSLIPFPQRSFRGFRLLQEYFMLPEKFLFLDLHGWEHWQERGEGTRFEIVLELDARPFNPPKVKRDSFALYATPVVNIFPHEADPVRLDQRRTEYRISPSATNPSHYQVYAVEKVTGYIQGSAEQRPYVSFEVFDPEAGQNPVYHIRRRRSAVRSGLDVFLSVAYPAGLTPPVVETLSISLLCTNGFLPDAIQVGDICQATSTSPEFLEFSNIRPLTANTLPPLGTGLLWRLLSHLFLNYTSIASPESLRALLGLYIFEQGRDQTRVRANQKRVSGIKTVVAGGTDRLVSGVMMRGQALRIGLDPDHFAGPGDLYLFGCVLDFFFGLYASLNTYTSLTVEDVQTGELHQWAARIGDHPLI